MKDARWFNPLNGEKYKAEFDNNGIKIDLRSGESMILQTYNSPISHNANCRNAANCQNGCKPRATVSKDMKDTRVLDGKWKLSFINSAPEVTRTWTLDSLRTWETLDDDNAKETMGTGVYTTTIKMNKQDAAACWMIDLGDVRESARVYVNGKFIGCAWAVPFTLECRNAFKPGDNEIKIEVTNLPANRIAAMDRKGIEWRKFNEINIVDIKYKKTKYDQWKPVESGLNSNVILYKMF